jgi:hypothetical protein
MIFVDLNACTTRGPKASSGRDGVLQRTTFLTYVVTGASSRDGCR